METIDSPSLLGTAATSESYEQDSLMEATHEPLEATTASEQLADEPTDSSETPNGAMEYESAISAAEVDTTIQNDAGK